MWDRHCLLVTFCPRIMVCSHGPSFGWYARYLMAWGWPDSGPLSMETFYWEADPSNQGFVPWGGGHTRMISPSKAHSLCKPIVAHRQSPSPGPKEAVPSPSAIAVSSLVQQQLLESLYVSPKQPSCLIWHLWGFPLVFQVLSIPTFPAEPAVRLVNTQIYTFEMSTREKCN